MSSFNSPEHLDNNFERDRSNLYMHYDFIAQISCTITIQWEMIRQALDEDDTRSQMSD